MKKIISIIMILILFLSGFGASALIENTKDCSSYNYLFDLLIISPDYFIEYLESLVNHKQNYGLRTKLVSLDNIYNGIYFPVEGRDDAEKLKYFIKNSLDTWSISYVLIVGGRKHGLIENWHSPVRYVTFQVPGYKTSYISDLYFADIYDEEGLFQSWDKNNDDKFGTLNDKINCYPDVYVGRWACRNKIELKNMVEKTIEYESNTNINNKIVLIGGDTFTDSTNYDEGELITTEASKCLPDFEVVKVFSSEITVSADNIREGLGTGALFMHFKGHGWVTYWNTYKHDQIWTNSEPGFGIWDIPSFSNKQYPIVIFGGCNTGMLNVSLFNRPNTWHPESDLPLILKFFPAIESISWCFTRKPNGGSIACIGYTGASGGWYGENGDMDNDGILEPDCIECGSGFMEINFFNAYGNEGKQYLGDCWGYSEDIYIKTHGIKDITIGNIQKFILLGDPSLKIGGYQ